MNRRDLLAGAAAWWTSRLPVPGSRLPIRDRLGRIGIQLYTLRRAFARDPDGTLAKVAELGYREVEFAGYPPGTPQEIRRMLQRHGLRAVASHVQLRDSLDGWDRTLEQAATIGQRYVVVASIAPGERRTLDDWKRVADRFNRAGQAARKQGLTFGYHNHDFEFPPLDGVVPYDLLLAETDRRLVQLELDLYWCTKGGKDPLDYFAKWPGRFPLVHVKDMDATPQRGFADVGKGIIDFRRIFAKSKQAGIQHYLYEQDMTPGDPFESAGASYRYLRALTF